MENEHNSNNSNNNHFFNNGNNLSSNTYSNSVDTSFMFSLNNIIQESNSYYQSSIIEAFQNLHEEVSQEEFLNDEDNSLYDNNNNLSSLSSKNSFSIVDLLEIVSPIVKFPSSPQIGVSMDIELLSPCLFCRFLLVISVLNLFIKQEYKKPLKSCVSSYLHKASRNISLPNE